MAYLYLDNSKTKHVLSDQDALIRELNSLMRQVDSVRTNLRYKIACQATISARLLDTKNQIGLEAQRSAQMRDAFSHIIALYQQTETKNSGFLQADRIETGKNESQIDSIVFDDEGLYGGDQGAPRAVWRAEEKAELYQIVRQYYPNMSDDEIRDYLDKLNNEGCGYVAIINTIFAAYEGREEEFEKTFGFPMYGNDGDLNYNHLLVDFYSATDNHNRFLFWDTVNNNEDPSSTKGSGTTPSSRKYRTSLYLSDKGVEVDIDTNVKVTPENFSQVSNDRYIVIRYHNGNLQYEDGSTAQYINGGHAMVVTGVTEDGRYIVSSWGDKYYIDPNEIITNGSDKTWFDFMSFKY